MHDDDDAHELEQLALEAHERGDLRLALELMDEASAARGGIERDAA